MRGECLVRECGPAPEPAADPEPEPEPEPTAYICTTCGRGALCLDGRGWYHTETPDTSHILTHGPRPAAPEPFTVDGLPACGAPVDGGRCGRAPGHEGHPHIPEPFTVRALPGRTCTVCQPPEPEPPAEGQQDTGLPELMGQIVTATTATAAAPEAEPEPTAAVRVYLAGYASVFGLPESCTVCGDDVDIHEWWDADETGQPLNCDRQEHPRQPVSIVRHVRAARSVELRDPAEALTELGATWAPDFDAYASGRLDIGQVRCLLCGQAPCNCEAQGLTFGSAAYFDRLDTIHGRTRPAPPTCCAAACPLTAQVGPHPRGLAIASNDAPSAACTF